jgi:predicted TIM-barrel fold metal-dependent hydrolase
MLTVDVHAHLGVDQVFEVEHTQEALLSGREAVDITLVQPASVLDLPTVRAQHDAVAALAREQTGRFLGMACPNPRLPEDEYFGEVRRCVQELGFVGLKLHPLAHAVAPSSRAGRRAFEAARTLGVPLMIHTGTGIPWSAPSLILPVAREYPDVRIVMAHAGMMVLAQEALVVAQSCDNVWLETTWTGGHLIRRFIDAIGAERVLFGSDLPINLDTELTKHRTLRLSEAHLERLLGENALDVYRLSRDSRGTATAPPAVARASARPA